MSESGQNHLTIDGGQGRDDEHVGLGSYKPIPESDTVPDFRTSKSSLSKLKEKVSPEEEEKLLLKEDEAKIVTRVDMADAKYVVEDHRNGDAKIELDANKRDFYGLTKEELMKYAEDPFWVRLRWFLFVLFWALWLGMLAAAVIIIIYAPKCYPPPPKTWYQKGPLVDMSSVDSFKNLESELPMLQNSKIQGIFTSVCKDTYEVLDNPSCLNQFKDFVAKAKKYSIKVIVDLTANFVSKSHPWFAMSVNRSAGYEDFFVWGKGVDFNEEGKPLPPNKWVSTMDTPAWSFNEERREYYLHQYSEDQPDLNFTNHVVVRQFDRVLRMWMEAGADGIRLHKVRQLVVNASLAEEVPEAGTGRALGTTHSEYGFWQHKHTSDQPELDFLLAHWAYIVDNTPPAVGYGETVFTLKEERRPELILVRRNVTFLRPPSAAPLPTSNVDELVTKLNGLIPYWPAVQLMDVEGSELSSLAVVLPAAPLLDISDFGAEDNVTDNSNLGRLATLRDDASIEHGAYNIAAVPARNSSTKLIACARWKSGHTGYVAVYNPGLEEARANLTAMSLPNSLAIHHISLNVKQYTNYTKNMAVGIDDVLVPPKSTVLLSYVPKAAVED